MSTEERLVEAARELLWERGYVGTSPKAIQREAGAGQGSMYHHFDGKPGLALAAITRTAREMRRDVEAVLDAPGSASERLAAYLRRERDVLRGCPVGRLTMDPEVMASEELRAPVTDTLGWLRERLARVVQDGVDQGEFPSSRDARETAALVLATVQGGYVLARAAGTPDAFDTAVDGLLAVLLPGG